jgi:hypothetical protein
VAIKQPRIQKEDVMNRIHATLRLAGFAFALQIACNNSLAQVPPAYVAGNWTIYSTSIANGATEVKHVQVAQYGNSLSGFFEGPYQAGPIQGSVNGYHVKFSTKTRNVLTFRGMINGNMMSGLYGLHGRHSGWQAVRTTGVGLAFPAPPANYYPYQPAPVSSYTYQPAQVPAGPVPQAEPQPAATTVAPNSAGPTAAPQSADQLDALVAPIALYPDALVAQVLAASTFPDQIAIADYWLSQNSSLTGAALAQAVDQQTWDPSVKALTQFPSVLDNLAKNLAWTSSLGQVFHNQQADVMAAVQAMRAKAQAAGTLQSTSQITVTQPSPSVIVIQPANPQVVYVPQYNPTIVYGAVPLVVPFYTPPVTIAAATVSFGSGIAIGAVFGGGGGFVAGGGSGWGFHAWGLHWGGGGGGNTIIYNHNTYITNNTWHTNNYNGYHPWGPGPHGPGPYGPHPYGPGYVPTRFQPNGGHNGDHGLIGGNGGVQRPAADYGDHAAGFVPTRDQPNGGRNGDHGLIGGNGGVQNSNAGRNGPGVAPNGGYSNNNGLLGGRNQEAMNRNGGNPGRSRMSGDGGASRAESYRGRGSMAGRRPEEHMGRPHAPAEHHSSGGGRRR